MQYFPPAHLNIIPFNSGNRFYYKHINFLHFLYNFAMEFLETKKFNSLSLFS
jgi:hypothetical protein